MKIHQLQSKARSKNKKRLGRGYSSGRGKTSGRGAKGQKARTGYKIPLRFEGGQMPLIQRLPKKRGFKPRSKAVVILDAEKISKIYKAGEIISPKSLAKKGIAIGKNYRVKILNTQKLAKDIKIKGCLTSRDGAKSK